MKQRGRKSIGDLEAVAFPDARIVAPESLTESQRAEWRAIVDSLPASYFRPADVCMLAQLCRHSGYSKELAESIERDGLILKTEKGWPYPNPALSALNGQSAAIAQLSQKLRLCPSARMVQSDAEKQAGDGAKGARPWDAHDKPQNLAS